MFTFGHRPETWQRVRLGADARRHAARRSMHEAIAETSRFEDYVGGRRQLVGRSSTAATTSRSTTSSSTLDQLHADRHARARRGARRACARSARWTSWRYALGIDPLALRLQNYAERDPTDGPAVSPARSCAPATRRAPSASAGRSARPRRARCARAASSSAGAWPPASGMRCRCSPRAKRGAARRRPAGGAQRGHRHRHRHLHRDDADRGRRRSACRWSDVTLPARRLDAAGGADRRRLVARGDASARRSKAACEKLREEAVQAGRGDAATRRFAGAAARGRRRSPMAGCGCAGDAVASRVGLAEHAGAPTARTASRKST